MRIENSLLESVALRGELRIRLEPVVVTIIDHRHAFFSDAQLADDVVFLEVADGDDALAFGQDAWYHQTAVEPAHILIE